MLATADLDIDSQEGSSSSSSSSVHGPDSQVSGHRFPGPRQRVGGGQTLATVSTFENHCLEGKLTFGDPFEDSGVTGGLVGAWFRFAYLRLIDSCITQLKAQGPSRTCNESKEEEEEEVPIPRCRVQGSGLRAQGAGYRCDLDIDDSWEASHASPHAVSSHPDNYLIPAKITIYFLTKITTYRIPGGVVGAWSRFPGVWYPEHQSQNSVFRGSGLRVPG